MGVFQSSRLNVRTHRLLQLKLGIEFEMLNENGLDTFFVVLLVKSSVFTVWVHLRHTLLPQSCAV